MRRRKLRWAVAVGAELAMLAGVAAFALWLRPDRASLDAFRRIKQGMSRAEVHDILGPSGDYETGRREHDGIEEDYDIAGGGSMSPRERFPEGGAVENWVYDAVGINVSFTRSGEVAFAWYRVYKTTDRGFLASLRHRVERLWRRWFPEQLPGT